LPTVYSVVVINHNLLIIDLSFTEY